jgi:hypothetical protein
MDQSLYSKSNSIHVVIGRIVFTCCVSTRKAMVFIPLKQSQQSKGAKPDPSAFCRKAISLAKLFANKRSVMPSIKFEDG